MNSLNPDVATRSPTSTGKWHRIAYDDTACNRFISGSWVTKPIGEIDPYDLCRACWPISKEPKREQPLRHCAHEGCEATFEDHHWGGIEAHEKGWFMQRDDTAWCPDHNPEWVAEWRAKRAAGIPPEPWTKPGVKP